VANEAEILIVEDDEVIMGTLAYNLSRNGFGVSQATTGAEALRMARKPVVRVLHRLNTLGVFVGTERYRIFETAPGPYSSGGEYCSCTSSVA
jgi:hypothetical protein